MAETFTSMHMTLSMSKGSVANDTMVAVCVVKQSEGAVLGTISLTDQEQIYSIDNDLLYGRIFQLPNGADAVWAINLAIHIKAQRKIKIGDSLAVLVQGELGNSAHVTYTTASFFLQ